MATIKYTADGGAIVTGASNKEEAVAAVREELESAIQNHAQSAAQDSKDIATAASKKKTLNEKRQEKQNSKSKQMSDAQKEEVEATGQAAATKAAYEDYVKKITEDTSEKTQEQYEQEDIKLSQLKKNQKQAQKRLESAQDTRTVEKDLKELASWSDEDKEAMEAAYILTDLPTAHKKYGREQFLSLRQQEKALQDKYGKDRVNEILNSLTRQRNLEKAIETQIKGQSDANESWLKASGKAVAQSVGGAYYGSLGYVQELLSGRDKRFHTLDPNNQGNLGNVYSEAVQGQVLKNIDESGSPLAGVGSAAYQVGMGLADLAAMGAASFGNPAIGAVLYAFRGATGAVADASARGASPGQALAYGAAVALIEHWSEKISLGKLENIFKGGKKTVAKALADIGIQGATEAFTEEVSLFGSKLFDELTMGSQSERNLNIADAVANGMSYEEASNQENRRLLDETINTGLVSFFTGSIAAGVAEAPNAIKGIADARQTGQKQQDTYVRVTQDPNAQQVQQEAQQSPLAPETQQPQIDPNQTAMPGFEQEVQTQQATQQEQPSTPQKSLEDLMVENLLAQNGQQNPAQPAAQQKTLDDLIWENMPDPNAPRRTETFTPEAVQKGMDDLFAPQKPDITNPTLQQALDSGSNDGIVPTNIQAQQILSDPEAVAQLQAVTGIEISGTQVQKLVSVKEAVAKISSAVYNNKRSYQVQSVIDRLNNGGYDLPSIGQILSLPEIAAAEAANEGQQTIDFPNRDGIREAGYQKAMQKGSWNGKDYAGPIRQDRRMDIVIGLPGSGKSSVYTERLSQEHRSRVIDTDDFREYIPEYNGTNAGIVHKEASAIRNATLKTALKNGDNILLSTIGADAISLEEKIQKYKKAGYSVYLHLNELPNNKSMARAIARYLQEDGTTGRYVSPTLIAKYGDKPTETYKYLTGKGVVQDGRLGQDLRGSRQNGAGDVGRTASGNRAEENRGSSKGVTQYGELGGDLRTGRGPVDGRTGEDGSGVQGRAERLLAGYDWYNNDVERGQPPRLIQTSTAQEQKNSTQVQSVYGGADPTQVAGYNWGDEASGGFLPSPGDTVSKVASNTFKRANDPEIRAAGRDIRKNAYDLNLYHSETEAGQNLEADARTDTTRKILEEREYLVDKANRNEMFSGADVKTAMRIIPQLKAMGDVRGFREVYTALKKQETGSGQLIQAMAEFSRLDNSVGAANSAIDKLNALGKAGIAKRFYKEDGFDAWKESTEKIITDISNDIDTVKDGDSATMKQIIQSMAAFRRTVTKSGDIPFPAKRALQKADFNTLREIALRQLSMIPEDFAKGSFLKQANAVGINNMLASLKTFGRNIKGNAARGISDALSDSTSGRMADIILSKYTGVRVAGNDMKYTKEYFKAFSDSWDFASLCNALDIPTDNPGAYDYGKKNDTGGSTSLFSRKGNAVEKWFGAYIRHMNYALNATDSAFEGGAKGSTVASLEALGEKSGLTPEDIQAIGDYVGERRTYKETRRLTEGADHLKQAANKFIPGSGELLMPFTKVPSNVTHAVIDQSGLGIIEGLGEMISVARAAKNIESMTDQQRQQLLIKQRKAVSDFGRGFNGLATIGLAAVALSVGAAHYTEPDKDWDAENADLNQYMDGAQINWSALLRAFKGESTERLKDDLVTGMESLAEYEAAFALAYVWMQEDKTFLQKAGESAGAIYDSVVNSPFMQGLQDLQDLITSVPEFFEGDSDAFATAAGTIIGDVASRFYPAYTRNAAQAIDPVIRDTSDSNPLVAGVNRVKAAIPGLSKTLPAKIDPLTGEEQLRDDSVGEAIWNRVFAADATHRLKLNDNAKLLDDIYRETGNASIYPDATAPASFKYGGEEIAIDGKEDTELYMKTFGETTNRLLTDLRQKEGFEDLTRAEQAEEITEVYEQAKAVAEATVFGYPDFSERSRDEMFRLAESTGDTSVFYEPPTKDITYTNDSGTEIERQLTDQELQVYRDTERKILDSVMIDLQKQAGYKSLSDEQKLVAVDYAKEYAAKKAKEKAISDYYLDPEDWVNEVGVNTAASITQKMNNEYFNKAVNEVLNDIKHGFETEESFDNLDKVWKDITNLPQMTQDAILDQAEGIAKNYFVGRESGVTHYAMMKSVEAVKTVQGTGAVNEDTGKPTVRDIDKREAIGDLKSQGLSDSTIDLIMKAYMSDEGTTELKYDAIRDMGYDAAGYADVYRAYLDNSKKRQKIAAIMEAGDCDYGTANRIYKLFAGRYKPWE